MIVFFCPLYLAILQYAFSYTGALFLMTSRLVISLLLQWLVLNESLHSLIRSQSEVIIQFCCGAVAVLSTLPEQTLVVAKERRTLHLA